MSTRMEEECLSTILAKNLHSIVLGYFTFQELQMCICEEEWQSKVSKEFGHLLHYSHDTGGHETWYEYYCYLHDLVHKRATVIPLHENIESNLYLTYKTYFDEGKTLFESKWEDTLSSDLYTIVQNLCDGDIVFCGKIYFIVKFAKNIQRRYIQFKRVKSNNLPIHLFDLILKFPIDYWNGYNQPQLEMGTIIIPNYSNFSQLGFEVFEIANVNRMYIIINRGVAYALFLHDEDLCFKQEKYNVYSVAPIRNYMKHKDKLMGMGIYNGSKKSKPSSTQSILQYHNIGWDRVYITWQHLNRLQASRVIQD